jgi:biopolymer transport protein ExbD
VRKQKNVANLNLLPVMNLVTILIPLLLMGAQLMNLAVVDTTLPAICSSCELEAVEEEPLNLGLRISDTGLRLTGADKILDDPTIPCESGACSGLESYNFSALQDRLRQVKSAHPGEEALVVVPDESVPYEVIIGAIDAARQTGERLLFPSVTISGG